ncbi:hypothetical protein [Bacteroides sp. 519]|uniref:hypothetical protein n=1 Tax=Bacteroides sp. 519 TaxID=2302937 RepID=UPI0013D233CF|nr:hypothetical protein [Bacteroides sp. 519]NDV59151.1 hypothetical protein [Bacteroides sp. 519]
MKLKTNILAHWYIGILLLLTACGDTNTGITPEPTPNPDSDPGVIVELSTRSYNTDVTEEYTFSNLWLIVYDENKNIEYCRDFLDTYSPSELPVDLEIVQAVRKNLTRYIRPGKKTFYAIGNAPKVWVDQLEVAETTQTLDLHDWKWEEKHLPRLLTTTDGNGKTVYVMNKDEKYQLDLAHNPMPYSGFRDTTVIADKFNFITVEVLRAVSKLEVELLPAWKKDPDYATLEKIDFKEKISADMDNTFFRVEIQNRTAWTPLFEGDDNCNDPAADPTTLPPNSNVNNLFPGYRYPGNYDGSQLTIYNPLVTITDIYSISYDVSSPFKSDYFPSKVAYAMHAANFEDSKWILAYKTANEEQKTIKSVPIYFFENHPAFHRDDPTKGKIRWETYNESKHPMAHVFIKNPIGGTANPGITSKLFKLKGHLAENDTIDVHGAFRNHYYHMQLDVTINPFSLLLDLDIHDWTEIVAPTPPIQIP